MKKFLTDGMDDVVSTSKAEGFCWSLRSKLPRLKSAWYPQPSHVVYRCESTVKVPLLTLILILALALMTCDDGNGKNNGNGEPHESTITAFGKTAKVTGDASISSADFATAVENLGDTLSAMDADSALPPTVRLRLTNMMSHDITIVAGNAVPADVGGVLKVGAGYLKSNDMPTIGGAIYDLAANGAFAN